MVRSLSSGADCSSLGPRPARPVVVIWQSLVVAGYRSFFAHLAEHTGWRLALIAPSEFRELGEQLVACAPFAPPFQDGAERTPAFILKAYQPHVQIVVFRGLRAVLQRFLRGAPKEPGALVLCLAEPYSVTALCCWLSSRMAAGKDLRFMLFGLQNIHKNLSTPLRLMQRFLFKRSAAILSLGAEQDEVLRRHGYQGELLRFPLWFDSKRFYLRPEAAGITKVTLGYAGGLSEAKGILDFLAVLERHAASWAGVCRIRFAGGGPLASRVEAACLKLTALGLDCEAVGPLPAEAMPAFFASLDLLIVPSRTMAHWKEQFGRVIVEARATGTVAVGSSSGEIPQVVGGPDRVFQEGDLEHMGAVLERWFERLKAPGQRRTQQKLEAQNASEAYSDHALAVRFAAQLALLPP